MDRHPTSQLTSRMPNRASNRLSCLSVGSGYHRPYGRAGKFEVNSYHIHFLPCLPLSPKIRNSPSFIPPLFLLPLIPSWVDPRNLGWTLFLLCSRRFTHYPGLSPVDRSCVLRRFILGCGQACSFRFFAVSVLCCCV